METASLAEALGMTQLSWSSKKGTFPALLEELRLSEAAGGCASPAQREEPSAAFIHRHPPCTAALELLGTSPERVCVTSKAQGSSGSVANATAGLLTSRPGSW